MGFAQIKGRSQDTESNNKLQISVAPFVTVALDAGGRRIIVRPMKKIFACFLIASLAVTVARAQENATQQEIDKLNGQIQDMEAAQAAQEKHIEALQRQINKLSSQLNQSSNNEFASQDDLQKLAHQVQEIDKKRQADNQRVLKELEHLENTLGTPPSGRPAAPKISSAGLKNHSSANGQQSGYNYIVQKGDTISAIARAYRAHGVKVTTDEILKANPGLNPKSMKVGQKIFIPAPPP